MKIKLYHIDAFADQVFSGNPAAVCPLEEWLPKSTMQQIAAENNLSETAFFVNQHGNFDLKWFTPETEVDLCGHATLASAHVIFNHLGNTNEKIEFTSNSGMLSVSRNGDRLTLNFPVQSFELMKTPEILAEALGANILETYKSSDLLVLLESEEDVLNLSPDFVKLKTLEARGIIVTAKGTDVDFVSRFFAPQSGINEDPVTGSTHTILTPFWESKTGKKEFSARQVSKRGGNLHCRIAGNRIEISGKAFTYLTGEITI